MANKRYYEDEKQFMDRFAWKLLFAVWHDNVLKDSLLSGDIIWR